MTKYRVRFTDGEIRTYDNAQITNNGHWLTVFDNDDTNKITYSKTQICFVEEYEEVQNEYFREPGISLTDRRIR